MISNGFKSTLGLWFIRIGTALAPEAMNVAINQARSEQTCKQIADRNKPIFERLLVVANRYDSREAFYRALKIDTQAWEVKRFEKYLNKESCPGTSTLEFIANRLRLNEDWLVFGSGKIFDEDRAADECCERLNFLAATYPDFETFRAAAHEDAERLRRYLNGTTTPRRQTLTRIAESCGVSADWLINGVSPMRDSK